MLLEVCLGPAEARDRFRCHSSIKHLSARIASRSLFSRPANKSFTKKKVFKTNRRAVVIAAMRVNVIVIRGAFAATVRPDSCMQSFARSAVPKHRCPFSPKVIDPCTVETASRSATDKAHITPLRSARFGSKRAFFKIRGGLFQELAYTSRNILMPPCVVRAPSEGDDSYGRNW